MADSFSINLNADTSSLNDISEPSEMDLAYESREEIYKLFSDLRKDVDSYISFCNALIEIEQRDTGEGEESGWLSQLTHPVLSYVEVMEDSLSSRAKVVDEVCDMSVDEHAEMAETRVRDYRPEGTSLNPTKASEVVDYLIEARNGLDSKWSRFTRDIPEAYAREAWAEIGEA